jgi:hypothetical protein
MTRYFICVLIFLVNTMIQSQSAGENTYSFLDLTNSARVASLGGQQISIVDDDLNMVYHNPSLLNGSMSDHIVLNYIPYIADIGYGYFSYARTVNKIGNIGAGIHYIDYGTFKGADEYGNITQDFSAKEFSFNIYYSRPVFDSLLHVGGTLKLINSHLETYKSFGIALDAGVTYASQDKLFAAALVLKNMGCQLTTYYEGADREPLPFEIQLGLSRKLEHAPFRVLVTFQHLETPDLRYKTEADKEAEQETNQFTGQTKKEDKLGSFASNIMRHTVFGLEFLPSKYFNLQFGYNYRRRQELKIPDKGGFVGFSWGLGLKLKNVTINYGRARYHLSGASNHISIGVNIDGFKKS